LNLSVISVGHVHTEAIEPLTAHLTRLEQVVTNLDATTRLADHRAEINRAVDAAANDWVLIIREHESVDAALAQEIAANIASSKSWGYRIRTQPLYAGKPLRIGGTDDGELRLFHRRHLLRRGDMMVEGSVVRMESALKSMTFASYGEHREYLQQRGVPHSTVRRTLLFLRNARTLDLNTLRYLWIEAGYDAG
jgi:hypothetical protein